MAKQRARELDREQEREDDTSGSHFGSQHDPNFGSGDAGHDPEAGEGMGTAEPGVQETAGESGNGAEPAGAEPAKKKKTDDEKIADFRRLASNRASTAFDALTVLGNCANATQYLWTEEQENKIFSVLEEKIRNLRAGFKSAREAAANRMPGERGKRSKAHSVLV